MTEEAELKALRAISSLASGTDDPGAAIREILFDQAKVAVVPGLPEWFGPGAAGYIRLSFATSQAILDEALDRITLTIRNL